MILLICNQFFERTEKVGNKRKNVPETLMDNPRQLGKGLVRLVARPLMVWIAEICIERQYSPVPLAAFARRQLREKGTERRGLIRNQSDTSEVIQAGFAPG